MHLRRTVRALHQVSFLETTRVCTTESSVHEHAAILEENTRSAGQKRAEWSCRILYWFCEGIRSCTPLRTSIKSRSNWHWRLSPWSPMTLNGREQFVPVDNIKSKPLPVTSGVPQGSLLGRSYFAYTSTTCKMPSDLVNPLYSQMT